jgi:hypothetical protein
MEVVIIPATGHDTEPDAAVEATCTSTGLTEGSHCSVCDKVLVKQEVIPSMDHTPSDWIIDQPAEVEQEGHQKKECTECGILLEEEVIPALPNEGCGALVSLNYMGMILVCATVLCLWRRKKRED